MQIHKEIYTTWAVDFSPRCEIASPSLFALFTRLFTHAQRAYPQATAGHAGLPEAWALEKKQLLIVSSSNRQSFSSHVIP